jgi:uncharacterized integral membrane protein (TIGR00697 family)
MNKKSILIVLAGLYCACIVISNIIVGKQIGFAGVAINTAMILFPIVYIVNDVVVEAYGYKTAKTIIWAGFACAAVAALAYQVTLMIPGAENFTNQTAFEAVLGATPRILLGSMVAYLVGSFINAKVMAKMKAAFPKQLFARCATSTLAGETIDAIVFYLLAFAFVLPWSVIVSLIVSASIIKVVFEVVMYPVTRRVIGKVKKLPETSVEAMKTSQ